MGEEVGEEVREESREGSGESSVTLYYVEDGAESLLPDARLSDEESEVNMSIDGQWDLYIEGTISACLSLTMYTCRYLHILVPLKSHSLLNLPS